MSVATIADIQRRRENGSDDPSLPIAVWQATVNAAGNATGGFNIAQINLKAALTQPGNLFSLEQLSVRYTAVAATNAVVLGTDGMESLGHTVLVAHYGVPVVVGGGGATDLFRDVTTQPRLWVGQAAAQAAAGTLSFEVANLDAETLTIACMGYMWTPRSLTAPGGLRRPASGFFPN